MAFLILAKETQIGMRKESMGHLMTIRIMIEKQSMGKAITEDDRKMDKDAECRKWDRSS